MVLRGEEERKRKRTGRERQPERVQLNGKGIKRNSKHLQCIYVRFLFPVKVTLKCLKNIDDRTFFVQR